MNAPNRSQPDNPPDPLVGRDRERAALRKMLGAAFNGRGGLVLIAGEAGIGKTTLAEALCREASDAGALVLIGRAYDHSGTPPYGLWRDALAAAPRNASLPELPTTMLPPGRAGDSPVSQDAVFRHVLAYLAALAQRQPLVLLLDDLHWADPDSLDLLRALGRVLTSLPFFILATYRSDELNRRHLLYALLPLVIREAHAERLDLRPLEDAAFHALLQARYHLPAEEETQLVAYLQGRAEGNPFFADELLRALEEMQTLRRKDRIWLLDNPVDSPVPLLLRQVIDTRVSRLGEVAHRFLRIAAVIGQEVPLDLWQTVSDAGEDELLAVAERAHEAHIIAVTAAGGRFVHALIRDALYEDILPPRRNAWHRRIGEALAELSGVDPDAVAAHFRRAGDRRAIDWLIKAGDRAERDYAWLAAAERFEGALALLEEAQASPIERGWLTYRLASLRRYTDPQWGIGALEGVARLATAGRESPLAANVLYSLGELRSSAGDLRRGLAEMELAVARLADLPSADRPPVPMRAIIGRAPDPRQQRAGLAFWLAAVGRFREAAVFAHEGEGQSARGRAAIDDAGAYLALGLVQAANGRPDAARSDFARARAICDADGHHGLAGLAALYELLLVALQYRADDLAERRRLAAVAEGSFARAGGAFDRLLPRAAWGPLLMLEGLWEEARMLTRPNVPADAAQLWWRVVEVRILAPLARQRADSVLANLLIEETLPDGPTTEPGGTPFFTSTLLQRLAVSTAIASGDFARARSWLDAHDRWLTWSGAVLGQAEGHQAWADYHRATGDLAMAREHGERALACATEPRQPLVLIAANRNLGELAIAARDFTTADEQLRAALALAEACIDVHQRALTLLALAELHVATGKPSEAQRALDEGQAICTTLGAQAALARAEAVARRLAQLRPPRQTYPCGLTRRELDVLRLIATGRTNDEIAEVLYLSRRTVERHTSNLYRKIAARGRSDAIAFAFRHELP